MSNEKNYGIDKIKVLSDIEHIRLRPGMYIGTVGDGSNPIALFNEAFDNALDEAQNKTSDSTDVRISKIGNDYKYYVRDYGRGIPIGKIKTEDGTEMEALEILCTKTNSGAKFNSEVFKIRSGLHGVGMCCICALSKYMKISTIRDSQSVTLVTELGKVISIDKSKTKESNGVEIEFIADDSIFGTTEIPKELIVNRAKIAQAMGYKVNIIDENGKSLEIESNSIIDLIPKEDVSIYCQNTIRVDKEDTGEFMIVGYQYTSDTKCKITGYTNLLYNRYGGTHNNKVRDAIPQAWEQFTKNYNLKWDDCTLGLRIVVAIFINEPAFSSQTKEKLSVPASQIADLVSLFRDKFSDWIKDNPKIAEGLIERFVDYRQSQNNLQSQKDIMKVVKVSNQKSSTDKIKRSSSIVESLMDCSSTDRKGTELFVCLHGDTKVKLCNGETPTLKELSEIYTNPDEEFWVHSCDDDGNFIPVKAHNPRIIQYVDKLIKLKLSDGTEILCTPDHKFLNKDTMDWIRADEMIIGTSLHKLDYSRNDCYLNIISIESIKYDEKIPVYCLTVDSNHRFALENGVISKNCEGLSAAGAVARPRDRRTQAVLPLRGKIKNIANMDIKDALKHETILNIVNAIGANVGDASDPEKSRYERINILTDADEDGCVTGETELILADGTTVLFRDLVDKKINSVDILCKDENGKTIVSKGCNPRITKNVTDLINIEFCDGKCVRFTPDHKIMLPDFTYKKAEDLKAGDYVCGIHTGFDCSEKIKSISKIFLERPIPVYDITVHKHHNYLIKTSNSFNNTGVFIHNSHITALLITAFVNLVPNLVKAGMIYAIEPPLYKYYTKDGKAHYTSNFDEIPEWSYQNGKMARFKGLGSMDDSDFKEACLNIDNRISHQISYPDDIDEFNNISGTSWGRSELLSRYGVIKNCDENDIIDNINEE